MPKPSNSEIIMEQNPSSAASEAYRSLRFNVEASAFDDGIKTVTITSAARGEGKSTTALNLAFAYAQIGKKVVLVDADMRQPSLHRTLGEEGSRGLSGYLSAYCSMNEIVQETHVKNLSVITAGAVPPSPADLLASHEMVLLLEALKRNYDMVFIDTPPVLSLTDAKIMASQCDGVLLVVEYGKVKRNVAKKVKEELALAKAKLLGIVMNKISGQAAEAY
ncbi:Tyrosine-protein kinase YwqD [Paenibacillus konkukensis]|uniref:non-specific protein-tyrosine kinase n=1 Tax=Paenibacillus konkukensis TaxID=2020716 RepID=A0ABY4RVF4_9BACL|nr:CpsD/CapB family tyrosine-protein kinase [Paenibacillus konkukensis]UQZ85676.1 Tyrosine-protein kinase YwqD [Paenibacillus konkukensis]